MKLLRDYLIEMKDVKRMKDTELLTWLNKTKASLNSFARKGGPNTARGYDLRDRYDELKQEMIDRGLWKDWCGRQGFDNNHCSIDYFA
jgi:hypothetical protein